MLHYVLIQGEVIMLMLLQQLLKLLQLMLLLLPGQALFPEPELLDVTWTDSGDMTWTNLNEKSALVDLWRTAGGVHWTTTWDLRQDPCVNGWHGILCNEYGAVISIDLPRNRMNGFLPRSLGMLTSLLKFHVNDNLLTGPIPRSFEKLINLEYINLSQNRFTGPLPIVASTFPNLVLFHLASNDFDEKTLPDEYLQMEQRGIDVWVL
mgnify:CR=1 FL=1